MPAEQTHDDGKQQPLSGGDDACLARKRCCSDGVWQIELTPRHIHILCICSLPDHGRTAQLSPSHAWEHCPSSQPWYSITVCFGTLQPRS